MAVCLNYDIEMLRNLKALYNYIDRFLIIFSLVDASSRLQIKSNKSLLFINGSIEKDLESCRTLTV